MAPRQGYERMETLVLYNGLLLLLVGKKVIQLGALKDRSAEAVLNCPTLKVCVPGLRWAKAFEGRPTLPYLGSYLSIKVTIGLKGLKIRKLTF